MAIEREGPLECDSYTHVAAEFAIEMCVLKKTTRSDLRAGGWREVMMMVN